MSQEGKIGWAKQVTRKKAHHGKEQREGRGGIKQSGCRHVTTGHRVPRGWRRKDRDSQDGKD